VNIENVWLKTEEEVKRRNPTREFSQKKIPLVFKKLIFKNLIYSLTAVKYDILI
jgi:hypothetical protein